jgi:hypothetical protein
MAHKIVRGYPVSNVVVFVVAYMVTLFQTHIDELALIQAPAEVCALATLISVGYARWLVWAFTWY